MTALALYVILRLSFTIYLCAESTATLKASQVKDFSPQPDTKDSRGIVDEPNFSIHSIKDKHLYSGDRVYHACVDRDIFQR